jgi:hypothetical protein
MAGATHEARSPRGPRLKPASSRATAPPPSARGARGTAPVSARQPSPNPHANPSSSVSHQRTRCPNC